MERMMRLQNALVAKLSQSVAGSTSIKHNLLFYFHLQLDDLKIKIFGVLVLIVGDFDIADIIFFCLPITTAMGE